VISHPRTVAIPGAGSVEQLVDNAAAADLVLGEEQVVELDEIADNLPFVTGWRAVLGALRR